jgi:glucose 1-dehydrogenase
MRAITVTPRHAGSLALSNFKVPTAQSGSVLVETLAIGVCGTDREIIDGRHGEAPEGHKQLIIGHESIGRVVEAPASSGFTSGDLVVGVVRRPDPVPCVNCEVGEWDMCRNGLYTERGIKGLDGFGSDLYRSDPEFLVPCDPALGILGVLVEPASVIAKAWEHIEHIGRRARWEPRRVLVTGAGPVGLLAALAAAQRGLEVHVLDHNTDGPKPMLVESLGAHYHSGSVREAVSGVDIAIECTGAVSLIFDVIEVLNPGGTVCLTGISSSARATVDAGLLNREIVLDNNVIFGSVNANRRHYEAAVALLAKADAEWLRQMITRQVSLADWEAAYTREPGDVKTILLFDAAADGSP